MTVDPSWPLVGSKVTLLVIGGTTRARVQSYGKGEVRLVFEDPAFNPMPADSCGPAYRMLRITTFLRMVEAANSATAGGSA